MRRIVIALDGPELSALNTFAQHERRDPRAEAALLIRRALEAAGYLKVDASIHDDAPNTTSVTSDASS